MPKVSYGSYTSSLICPRIRCRSYMSGACFPWFWAISDSSSICTCFQSLNSEEDSSSAHHVFPGELHICASSESHEPKHQAWAGSLLTSCNTFREYTVYVYPPEFYSCQILSHVLRFRQILSDFVYLKTRSTRDRSIPRSLQRWVSTKILDLTAVVFSIF